MAYQNEHTIVPHPFETGQVYCENCGLLWKKGDPAPNLACRFPNDYHLEHTMMPQLLDNSDIRTVYEYTCDSCGHDNLIRPTIRQMSRTEIQQMIEDIGAEDELDADQDAFHCHSLPLKFECPHCKKPYSLDITAVDGIEGDLFDDDEDWIDDPDFDPE